MLIFPRQQVHCEASDFAKLCYGEDLGHNQ